MVSAMLAAERNPTYYLPDLHGRLFTLPAMLAIVRGLPGETWGSNLPGGWANYVEQMWNREPLLAYQSRPHRHRSSYQLRDELRCAALAHANTGAPNLVLCRRGEYTLLGVCCAACARAWVKPGSRTVGLQHAERQCDWGRARA